MNLKKLNELRLEREMTYQQVADLIGVSKEHYWFIENGKRGLSYEMAIKIAKVFNKTPDDIFFDNKLTNEEQKQLA